MSQFVMPANISDGGPVTSLMQAAYGMFERCPALRSQSLRPRDLPSREYIRSVCKIEKPEGWRGTRGQWSVTPAEIDRARQLRAAGKTIDEIARELELAGSTVSKILRGVKRCSARQERAALAARALQMKESGKSVLEIALAIKRSYSNTNALIRDALAARQKSGGGK